MNDTHNLLRTKRYPSQFLEDTYLSLSIERY
jgi:hypothetical protein